MLSSKRCARRWPIRFVEFDRSRFSRWLRFLLLFGISHRVGGAQWCIRSLNGFVLPAKRRSSRGSQAKSGFMRSTAGKRRLLLSLNA
jgi:hypothetical protein